MSDHIEAIAAVIRDLGHDPKTDAERAWAAGVEALIAHEPCSGNGCNGLHLTWEQPHEPCCPGPHTVIVKGDGTKLHADAAVVYASSREAIVPLPSEWRIE